MNSDGSVTYTAPTQSVPGNAASFSYTVTDTAGLSSAATANISLTTAPPVVQAETFSTGYGKPLTLTPAQLLAGDSDPQGGTLTVTAVSGPGATLNSDGSVTYTAPTQSVPGNAASFSYTVTDTAGLSSTATANISLTTAPGGAGRDLQHRLRRTADPHPGTAAGRRQRSAGRHADRHGREQTGCDVEQRWFGHLHRATQSVPGNAASFSYTVTDTAGLSSTATANISLTTAPPVVQAETFSTGYGKPLTLTPAQLLAGDSDPQGGTLTVTAVSGRGATSTAMVRSPAPRRRNRSLATPPRSATPSPTPPG